MLGLIRLLIVGFAMMACVLGQNICCGQQPNSPLVESYHQYDQMRKQTTLGLEWINVSPVVNSARVEAVQLHASKPGLMYVAFGSGGLWKTTNNGMTWKSIFENQTSYGIGDIAVAPSDPDIIYVGTGESLKKGRNFTIPGTGVYRSDDGGKHWRHLGLSDSWHIGEIAVHPKNPNIAVVAVLGHFWSKNKHRGLYRTEDGGKTWKHVLFVNDRTGGNDVVWANDDPQVVYASMWENNPDVNGRESAVYRSTNGGIDWQKCEGGFPSGSKIGRIGLAVSSSDSRKVYALIDDRGKIQEGAAQVYRSTDGGETWQRTHKENLMISSRIGWYFADIYVNPKNDDEIFALGVRVAHSKDGGKTFELVSGKVTHLTPSAASGLHLDHCEMWINPANPDHLVLGNDGGLYQSHDKGKTWLHFNNLPTGEFYDIAIEQSPNYRIYGGTQDNSTVFGRATELGPARLEPWKYLWIDPWNGGDGCISQVDPSDPNTVYFSAQEGAFRRKDMARNRAKSIRPGLPKGHDGKLSFNFIAPMILSPHDSKTLYLGGNYVFRSRNRGDDWKLMSGNIARSKDSARNSIAASSIAESSLEKGLIYIGTDRGALWASEDDGENWTERSDGLPHAYIRSIFPSRFRKSRVYLSASGINYDDLSAHLYCSEDQGKTWRSISANLPAEPVNVIVEDSRFENVLFVGTFRGVYVSRNRGETWALLGRNLPTCSVSDIAIHETSQDMVVSTHGRGIFKLNLKPLHAKFSRESGPSEFLYDIPQATRPYLSDGRPGANFRAFEKTPITFELAKAGSVAIAVLSKDGKALARFDVSGHKGLNQFRWDLVTKTNESSQPYFINYRTHLTAGRYRVQIKTPGNTVLEKELRVVDP